mgnify:FL=1
MRDACPAAMPVFFISKLLDTALQMRYTRYMIKILILGGGFGGVKVALDLSRFFSRRMSGSKNRGSSIPQESGSKNKDNEEVHITLIDKSECQTFTPALYEVASVFGVNHEHPYHGKIRGVISIPYGEIFRGKNIELVQAEINHIDLAAKHVVTNNGATIDFDYLVIAFGSTVSTFGIPGVEE